MSPAPLWRRLWKTFKHQFNVNIRAASARAPPLTTIAVNIAAMRNRAGWTTNASAGTRNARKRETRFVPERAWKVDKFTNYVLQDTEQWSPRSVASGIVWSICGRGAVCSAGPEASRGMLRPIDRCYGYSSGDRGPPAQTFSTLFFRFRHRRNHEKDHNNCFTFDRHGLVRLR